MKNAFTGKYINDLLLGMATVIKVMHNLGLSYNQPLIPKNRVNSKMNMN